MDGCILLRVFLVAVKWLIGGMQGLVELEVEVVELVKREVLLVYDKMVHKSSHYID